MVTADESLAKRVHSLREYGWKERYISHEAGMNSRLDEIQAAILRVKLAHLDSDTAKRVAIADKYRSGLEGLVDLPQRRHGTSHVYHQFVIKTKQRDELLNYLRQGSVGAGVHYPEPVHCQAAYLGLNGELSVSESLKSEILSLPMYPELSDEQVQKVIQTVKDFFWR